MNAARKYMIWGALFGCCFPVFGTIVRAAVTTRCIHLPCLMRVQASDPLIWIIDSAPFWLGLFAYWVGKRDDRLTRLIREREATIENRTADLQAALKRAEEANRTKSRFLANMSHEIRTPMTAILGYAENLLDSKLDAARRAEAVHIIYNNGEHLLQVINEILDFSKLEEGKLKLEQMPCSPLEIIADVTDLVSVHAKRKDLEYRVEFTGPMPAVIHGDPTRIRQILLNLLGNAVKFTERGTVRLIAGLTTREDGETCLEFQVRDTGVGMTAEQIEHVFHAFAQADGSTSRRFGGTGLGLAICKRLVGMLGGLCRVESQPGIGSTFAVALPVGDLAGVEMISEPVVEAGRRDRRARVARGDELKGRRLLLAEDNPFNRRLISAILEKCGAEVAIAENGAVAVEAALTARDEGAPHDLVLMDIQMPGLDGYEAARRLRQVGYDRPIVALTASALAGDRQLSLDAGCDDYLTKPIEREKFLETIERWAGRCSPAVTA